MLEQLRRNSRSWLIWLIFAMLIAAFVLFFGPQSNGPEMFGCGVQSSTVAEVDDNEVKVASWRFAMVALGGGSGSGGSAQAIARRSQAIDYLVEREILIAEARRLGMRVSDDLVLDHIKVGDIYMLGSKVDGKRIYFPDNYFSLRQLELTVQNWGLSLEAFINEQRLEILANLARDTLIRSAQVSVEEARSSFIASNTTVTFDYVTFPVSKYAAALTLDQSHVDWFLANHAEEVNKAWEQEKAQFASEKDRVQLRILLINKDPTPPVPAKETNDDSEPPTDKPIVLANKKKADELHAKLIAGADFAAIVREHSDDQRSKKRSGLLEWRSADSIGYGTAVVEAVKTLELNQITDVIEAPRGYYIAKLEARSDKALSFDQRKDDIAYRLASVYYAEKLAARDANRALARIEEGKKLGDVFDRAPAAFRPGQGMPSLSPEQLKRMQEQIRNMTPQPTNGAAGKDGGKQGWIYSEGDTQLAQAGSTNTVSAAAKVDTASTTTTMEEEGGPSAEAPPADLNLPDVSVAPPKVAKLGPLSRPADKLAGIGRSKHLIADLFDNLEEGQVAQKIYSVSEPDALVIVQLIDRTEADLDKFTKDADAMRDQMVLAKGFRTIVGFVTRRCQELAKSGDIGVNNDFLIYDKDKPPIKYSACTYINERSIGQQFRSRYPSFFGG